MRIEIKILWLILYALLFAVGCSKKHQYVEVFQGSFDEIEISQITLVTVMNGPYPYPPPNKKGDYHWMINRIDGFPVNDPENIKILYECIKNAKKTQPSNPDFGDQKLVFVSNNTTYYLAIAWDKEKVYGDWWESKQLQDHFEAWRLQYPTENSSPGERMIDIDVWGIDDPNDSFIGNEDK